MGTLAINIYVMLCNACNASLATDYVCNAYKVKIYQYVSICPMAENAVNAMLSTKDAERRIVV